MTLEELGKRVRASSIVEVLSNIANDPIEAREFILTLGPHLVAPFLRAQGRKKGVLAPTPGRSTVPTPRDDWALRDWRSYADWLGKTYKGFGVTWRWAERVVKAHRKDKKLPYTELRARLDPEDAARLDKLCGKLAA